MVERRVPVVIVAGFLGAGKTTLLNHLLSGARGARIGVVVNDFGSVNVDALSVAGQVDATVSLANGCLCCAVDVTGLDRMLGTLTAPSAGLDLVVVEASGLAEPRSLVRLVLASEDPHVEYGGLVEVVDAAEFGTTRRAHPELAEQLRFADLVVLNKTDRAAVGVPELVRSLAGSAPVLATTHGRIDPELLFDRVREPGTGTRQLSFDDLRDDEHEHVHPAYDSVTVTVPPVHPRRLARFLERRPVGLYRMKGFVHFGSANHREKYLLHTVGAYVRLERGRWGAGERPSTQLVLIGTGIDAAALRAELESCAVGPDEPVVDQDMLPMLRFLRYRPAGADEVTADREPVAPPEDPADLP